MTWFGSGNNVGSHYTIMLNSINHHFQIIQGHNALSPNIQGIYNLHSFQLVRAKVVLSLKFEEKKMAKITTYR